MRYSDLSLAAASALIAAVLAFPHTAAAAQPAVLATVGKEEITVEDLREFADSLPIGFAQGKSGFAADSLLLESLIDRSVLIKEAESAGIANEPWLDVHIDRYELEQVLLLYKRRHVSEQVLITEEDLLAQLRASGRDRAVRIAGIRVETEDEAAQLRNDILAGADFAQLARERSLAESRDQDGDMGRYMRKDEFSEYLREAVFALEPGEISQPVPVLYGDRWGYAIFKILDEFAVQLSDVENEVAEEVFGRKRLKRQQALGDSLRSEYEPQIHSDNVEAFLGSRGMSSADLADLGERPLFSYRGGRFTVNDYWRFVPESRRIPGKFESVDAFADFLLEIVFPSQLFIEEAWAAGLHETGDIRAKVEAKKLSVMLDTLRVRRVDRLVTISDDEVPAFYRDHPELFMTAEELTVNEVLVGSREKAVRIRERAEAGDNIEELAREHTVREEMGHHDGELKISKFSRYRQLYEAAKGSDLGSVHGPVETRGRFSVFKVRERTESTLKPLNQVEYRRARAFVEIRKRKLAYVEFVRALRDKYGVAVFHDRLGDLH